MTDAAVSPGPGSAPRLRRVLALRDLIVVAAAAMGPAFSLATTMAAMIAAAGRWTWLALTIVAVLMAMIAGGYRRLGERMRDAGSSYAWIRAAFGPVTGAYGAWVLLVANVFAVLATALPAGTYTLDLVAPSLAPNALAVALVGCGWIVASALLLWYGLRPTAMLTLLLLAAEVVVLAGAAALAGIHQRAGAVAFVAAPLEWGGLVAAIVVGIWMIDGWEVSASTAEEAQGDASVPGSGGLAGLVLTAVILLAAVAAFARVGTAAGFAEHQSDALAYVGGLLGGRWPVVLSVTVLVSLTAALQTTLVYLTRSVFGMGRDGLLPRALGRLDERAEPAAAIALIAGLSLVFTLAAGVSPTRERRLRFGAARDVVVLGRPFRHDGGRGGSRFPGGAGRSLVGRRPAGRRRGGAERDSVGGVLSCRLAHQGFHRRLCNHRASPGAVARRRRPPGVRAGGGTTYRESLLNDKEIVLTRDGLKKLEDELDELKTVHRREVNERIRQAKEFGDISENAEYEDAKQEQAFVEGRVLKLEAMIRNARVIDASDYVADEVHLGATIKVKETSSGRSHEFTIVGSAEADPKNARLSNESPVGRALMGRKKGETVDVTTPGGQMKYKIESINKDPKKTKKAS